MADRDFLTENQVEHQEENAGAQSVHGRALNEAQAAQILHFFQFELEDFLGDTVETPHLLVSEPETLYQLDIAQRLCRGTRKRRRFGDDRLLYFLDLAAQDRADNSEKRNGNQKCRRDRPVYAEGVDHHEHDADERNEDDVDCGGDKSFHVTANFLQLAQCFSAALVLEDLVGKVQRVADAVGVHFRAEPLHNHVGEIILKVLGDSRDERDSHSGQ